MWGQRHSQETTASGRDHWSKLILIYTRASLAEPTKSKVGLSVNRGTKQERRIKPAKFS